MNKQDEHRSVRSDLDLMVCVFLAALLAVCMMLSGHVLLNTFYMGILVLTLLLTYFFGIVTGMAANMLFIFAQALYMLYQNMTGGNVQLELAYWLLIPVLLNLAFYAMTTEMRVLQADNDELREAMVEHGAFDQETKLRTTVSFLEDAGVFIETNKRFNIPVSVVVIRIRYFSDLQNMLGTTRIKELVKLASDSINHATRDNDISYILNTDNPTWAVLLYADVAGANVAAQRIRDEFQTELNKNQSLRDVDLQLRVGVTGWDLDKLDGPNAFMEAGIKELEYDV
ncbi:GGDEF domain-containing protein [Lacticaseibacillus zhaodongensis]|uniref:GGDEF domain-containing protein n=2 Tax=Lacticaseibacillus zhaodongensis TaxID=2668065 RepID=UPI0012D32ECF|nr:GGDEF domain-containing protein [Lacticaseibacillus zhaodongensis]